MLQGEPNCLVFLLVGLGVFGGCGVGLNKSFRAMRSYESRSPESGKEVAQTDPCLGLGVREIEHADGTCRSEVSNLVFCSCVPEFRIRP